MSKQQRVTIKEIAKEAGVSLQTVSRVLNNRPDVAAKTRRRVKEIIAAHDYQPSSIARGITQGRSYILGVLSASLEYFGPARSLMGIEKQASKLGYTIILRVVHQLDDFDVNAQLGFFASQHVDGIIWLVQDNDAIRKAILKSLPNYDIPMIFNNVQPHPEMTIVDFDGYLGGRIATEHLIAQGYQNIGQITGPIEWCVARQRYLGWKDALQEVGYGTLDDYVVEGDWSARSGERCMAQLLRQYPDMDAVFVGNDLMALGAMKTARELGVRIPEDFAIVGYDDVPEAEFFYPPLTTVRHDLSRSAAFMVNEIDCLVGEANRSEDASTATPKSHLFEPELVIRKSSPKKTS
jgi:LacI family transcriptional regulator